MSSPRLDTASRAVRFASALALLGASGCGASVIPESEGGADVALRDAVVLPADASDTDLCASAVLGAPCPRALQCQPASCDSFLCNPTPAGSATPFTWAINRCGGPLAPPELA